MAAGKRRLEVAADDPAGLPPALDTSVAHPARVYNEYATLPVWMREDDLSGWKSSLYVWRRGNAD